MCKGWVVRGHRREFLYIDVDQWGRKDNPGDQFTLGGHYQWRPFMDPA